MPALLAAASTCCNRFGRLPFAFADSPTDLRQFGRSAIAHFAERIDEPVDVAHDFGKGLDAARAIVQGRVTLLAVEQERDDRTDLGECLPQEHHLDNVEKRPLDAQFRQHGLDVGIVLFGKIVLHFEHDAHFVGQ